jgi:hypothetical protein
MFSLQPPRHISTLPKTAIELRHCHGGTCFDSGRHGSWAPIAVGGRQSAAGLPPQPDPPARGRGDWDGPDSDIGRQLRYSLHLSKVYRSYNCFFDEPGESAVK